MSYADLTEIVIEKAKEREYIVLMSEVGKGAVMIPASIFLGAFSAAFSQFAGFLLLRSESAWMRAVGILAKLALCFVPLLVAAFFSVQALLFCAGGQLCVYFVAAFCAFRRSGR
jgi:hypothetical protein